MRFNNESRQYNTVSSKTSLHTSLTNIFLFRFSITYRHTMTTPTHRQCLVSVAVSLPLWTRLIITTRSFYNTAVAHQLQRHLIWYGYLNSNEANLHFWGQIGCHNRPTAYESLYDAHRNVPSSPVIPRSRSQVEQQDKYKLFYTSEKGETGFATARCASYYYSFLPRDACASHMHSAEYVMSLRLSATCRYYGRTERAVFRYRGYT